MPRFDAVSSPALALAALLMAATPAAAIGDNELNPSDLVPRYFSTERFATLTANELYDVNLALRRGRTIQLEGCSASESRSVFRTSLENRAPAVELLQSICGG